MSEVAYTKEERLALIKKVAERVQGQSFKSKMTKKSAGIRKGARADLQERADVRTANQKRYEDMMAKLDENYNQWTDADKYANEYYGDVYRDTVKFDNEWN